MTPTNISLVTLAGLILALGTGYLLLAGELAGVRRELAELRSESTNGMDGLFDLAKRTERGVGLLEARVKWLENPNEPRFPADCRFEVRPWPDDPATYIARTYPKGPNEL